MPKRFAKISVVFPALNEEKNIANCLSALLKQTVFPNEVIFVDHNSIDNTLEIAKSFVNKYKKAGIKLTITTEKKKGIANARNTGFNLATQPIIASTDSDCIPKKNWIEIIEKFFKENNAVACAGRTIHYDGGEIVKVISESGFYNLMYKFMYLINGFHPMATGNCALMKSSFIEVGGFDKNIISIHGLDDVELASKLSFVGKVKYNHEMIVETSFRTYNTVEKAFKNFIFRYISMIKIKQQFRKKRYKKIFNSIIKTLP